MGTGDSSKVLPTISECNRAARLSRLLRRGSNPELEFAKRWDTSGGDYCVYCLLENEKHVRYIGITNQAVEKRLAQHFADCGRGKNLHKENWLRSCRDRNIPVSIHVIRAGLTADQAGVIEETLIQLLKTAFRLTNSHAGGSTGYGGLSEESREKHRRNTRKGLIRSLKQELAAIDMERGYCEIEEWGYLNASLDE